VSAPTEPQAAPAYEPPVVIDVDEGQPSTVVAINQISPGNPG
jgi:hypothetical protein